MARRLTLRCVSLLLVSLISLTSACTDEPAVVSAASPTLDPQAEPIELLEPRARFDLKVDGAIDLTASEVVPVNLVTSDGGAEGTPALFSFGFAPQRVGDASFFRLAVDVVGTRYVPGSYEIPETRPDDPETGFLSHFLLVYGDLSDPDGEFGPGNVSAAREFSNRGEPCVVTIHEGEFDGELLCPDVADGGGETISVVVSWTSVAASD